MTRDHSANNFMLMKSKQTPDNSGAAMVVGSGPSLGSLIEVAEKLLAELQQLRKNITDEGWELEPSEAIAAYRASMQVDPDHGPIGNHEAEMAHEIRLLRAQNEQLKIKLSRMCTDA